MKRKDEEFAKSKFDEFLTSLTQHSPRWEEVKQADEPPDYYLHYEDQEFSLEVTSIMEMLDTGDETQSSVGISIFLGRFIEGIEQRAQSQGHLRGAYIVHLEPLKDFSAVRDSVEREIIHFVKATSQLTSVPEEVIYSQGDRRWSIQKAHGQENYIGYSISFDAKWEIEAEEELCRLIAEAISDKQERLQNIVHPKILLLIDAFEYVNLGSWKKCIANSESLSAFHTVFRVSIDGKSSVLYSEEEGWMQSVL